MTSDGLSTNELYLLANLDTPPNITNVKAIVVDNDKDDHINGIIMTLLDNYHDLGLPPNFNTISRDVFGPQHLSRQRADKLLEEIETVISHLHRHQVIHGDLYAHNIIYKGDDLVLTDFGAAFLVEDAGLLEKFIRIENRALSLSIS